MNDDLISRSALLEEYRDFKDMDCPSGHTVTADYMIELAEDAPAVDAEPVRHGYWEIGGMDGDLVGNWECSLCNETSLEDSDYCPNCGAKMFEDVDRRVE